jgi:hypothetical protein
MPHRSVWSFSKRRLLALSSTIRTRLPASSGCSPSAAARSKASTSSATIVKWNVEPFPGSLSAQIRPPMSSLSRLLMASPKPVPPYRRVVETSTWLKTLNRRSNRSFGMPIPVSRTAK